MRKPLTNNASSAASIRRKLRALTAVLSDPAATEHEKANAQVLKLRLQEQLEAEPTRDAWTKVMFRLGRAVKDIRQTAPPSSKADWTGTAFRFGRLVRRAFKV